MHFAGLIFWPGTACCRPFCSRLPLHFLIKRFCSLNCNYPMGGGQPTPGNLKPHIISIIILRYIEFWRWIRDVPPSYTHQTGYKTAFIMCEPFVPSAMVPVPKNVLRRTCSEMRGKHRFQKIDHLCWGAFKIVNIHPNVLDGTCLTFDS